MARRTAEETKAHFEGILERQLKGDARLWFHPFAEAVIDALSEKSAVSKADILAKLEAALEGKHRLGRATIEAAIDRLRREPLQKPSDAE
ncbi:hypothetical protein GCM10008171_29190 [Methylopila jiangsuensis]|uniref:Uncharacterized protein n=1 Tax=Methylopila jiangsuensis TaxID=586230 RepID=A0A9W6N4U0_9HYPH|nr:hypothetical protein [Methylopila jiangsuensis]MDR6284948.1 hypothetical protein [Methylopila jiangsuensis]GLK77665.1 hypothetical protein GCM10008171_29190 [Methylopila jiangsuensis]